MSLRDDMAEAIFDELQVPCGVCQQGLICQACLDDATRLADAALAVLGEVTVTEEWGVLYPGSASAVMWSSRADAEWDRGRCARIFGAGSVVHRTVVTTRRVGEWEVAE